ncbi:MAG: hypothetical protein WCI72_03800 [archaeon]
MIHVFDATSAREFNPVTRTIAIRCMSSENGRVYERVKYGELDSRKYVAILPLTFDDILPCMEKSAIGGDRDLIAFKEEQAREIGDFLGAYWGEFEDIMVHCNGGASRSPAVGAAIGDYFKLEYDPRILEIQENGPNSHVYSTLLNSLVYQFPDGKISRIH